jgi:hypothetical protein
MAAVLGTDGIQKNDFLYHISTDLTVLDGVTDGNYYDIPIPTGRAECILEASVVGGNAAGTDSVLSLEGSIINSFGNIVAGLTDNFVNFSPQMSTWAPTSAAIWEWFTSGSAGAFTADILTVLSMHAKGQLFGKALRLIVSADDGAHTFVAGTLNINVSFYPIQALSSVDFL